MERKHVVVISSTDEFVGLIRELLIDERYNVTTTNFVARTYQQIEALQPDLLMIDLVIQERAGWSLLDRLQTQAITSDIPVVVTSTDHKLLEQAEQNRREYTHSSKYVIQPFDIDILLATVEALIGSADRA
jgi:CheY-like chemotaxis protein